MTPIKLKNGSSEILGIITVTMDSMRDLFNTSPIVAIELVDLARNPKHDMWPGTEEKSLGLVENGHMSNAVRNVILSAAAGDGMDMRLTWPVVGEEVK